MNALRRIPFVPVSLVLATLALSACGSVNMPLSPHRIDVQQGNALEQEAVEKLKPGMTRPQVRFLLGTPLLVDPFRSNRWDYVYNYRAAGKLTEKKRLTLIFEGDVLARIEAEGLTPTAGQGSNKLADSQPSPKPVSPVSPSTTSGNLVLNAEPPKALPEKAVKDVTVQSAAPVATGAVATGTNAAPTTASAVEPMPLVKPQDAVKQAERSLKETSIVTPLGREDQKAGTASGKPVAVSDKPPEPVALQAESNVETIKPNVMPAFPDVAQATMEQAAHSQEEQVIAAVNAWAKAWRVRDEDAYLAAYAPGFRPQGGLSRPEWEKRRRLLLGLARNIDLKIDSVSAEILGDNRAQATFNQIYRSDSYQDAVIKQLKFIRQDDRWLIEEEKILGPLRTRK